jgi:hypothetical protein
MADETSTAVAASPLAAGRLGFQSRAVLVGTGIDVAALGSTDRTGNAPLVVELIGSSLGATIAGHRPSGDGVAVIFRYGAIVFFDVSPAAINEYVRQLAPHIRQPSPSADQETEVLDIRVEPTSKETVEGSTLILTDVSREKLQLVADVLAKSVSLAHHERGIERQFERIEPFAENLDHWGRGGRAAQELLAAFLARFCLLKRPRGRNKDVALGQRGLLVIQKQQIKKKDDLLVRVVHGCARHEHEFHPLRGIEDLH